MIDNFRGTYWFLSNFYPVKIHWLDTDFPTLEHAYQASKATNPEDLALIRDVEAASDAKRMSRRIQVRPDWSNVREGIMQNLLLQKFLPGSVCAIMLVRTGDEHILEGNTWHDNFWGSCNCPKCSSIEGLNKLGKMLMDIREELKPVVLDSE